MGGNIYVGTPTKEEIQNYFKGLANNDKRRSNTIFQDEVPSSEDELSASFEEFLKSTLEEKKAEAFDVPITPKDSPIVDDEESIADGKSAKPTSTVFSPLHDVDVSSASNDSSIVESRKWIVDSSIVIATPTVGDRKKYLQRCFKESRNNGGGDNSGLVRPSFGAFIQKKKEQLKKPTPTANDEVIE